MIKKLLALTLLLTSYCFASATIADTVNYPFGGTATGTLTISWPAFTTAAGRFDAAGFETVTLVSGAFSVTLDSTIGATPQNVAYKVTYNLQNGYTNTEYWIVFDSATSLTINQVRSSVPPNALTIPLPNTVVQNNTNNTYLTGTQNFTSSIATLPFVTVISDPTGLACTKEYSFETYTIPITPTLFECRNGTWQVVTSSGTLASVGLALPSIFTVSGSPVTSSGTLTGTLATETANTVFAGPTTGAAAAPTFRGLVSADIPNNAANTTGTAANVTGVVARANGGLNSSSAGTGILRDGTTPAASELSGDATTSGSNAVTVAKVNGVAYPASPATATIPYVSALNTVTYEPTTGTGTKIVSAAAAGTPGMAAQWALTGDMASAANLSLGTGSTPTALTVGYTNDGTTGTAVSTLSKISAANTVIKAATTDTDNVIGVCVSGCATTGSSQIALEGAASCVFDNGTTLGDYVQISSTTAGDCHDAGAAQPSSGEVLGHVLTTNASAGTYNVALQIKSALPNAPTFSGTVTAGGFTSTAPGPQATTWAGVTGSATLGVASTAGTPNRINVPTATGTSGQVLQTDGANPQQTSWTSLGGDVTGTVAASTVAKVNGTSVPTNSTADQTIVTTAAATGAWTSLPGCLDSGGNHLNYSTTTHSFSCGNTGGGAASAILTCVAASGSGTAYTCTTSPTFTPAAGNTVAFKSDVANTGAATLNVNSSAADPVKKQGGGTALVANDLLAAQWTLLTFDGTNWQMQGQTGNAAGGGSGSTITSGTFASLPATCTTGNEYLTTDSFYSALCTATNTYTYFMHGAGMQVYPPPASGSWTGDNLGSSTYNTTNGYLYFLDPSTSATAVRALYVSAPATPYTLTALVDSDITNAVGMSSCTECTDGIGFRDGTGKLIQLARGSGFNGAALIGIDYWTNSTTFSSTAFGEHSSSLSSWYPIVSHRLMWYQVSDDGTNLIFRYSMDGTNFVQLASASRTAFMASGPTQLAIILYANTGQVSTDVISWHVQ